MHTPLPILAALLLCACGTAEDTGERPMSQAIVDPERSSHFFDLPFPSDAELTAKGHPNLTGFPLTPSDITREIIAGWARRLEALLASSLSGTCAPSGSGEPFSRR